MVVDRPLGVGLTIAVLMDAFIIRGMLVPAVTKLAGEATWWAPRFLRPRSPTPEPVDRYPMDPDFVAAEDEYLVPVG